MLFRRFRQHISDHDWFAVTIDFFIVVVGIFAAMQADNWNEARKNRIQEREYLVRLYEDAVSTVETNETRRQFLIEHAQLASVVLDSLETCTLLPEHRDDFATGLYQLGKLHHPYMASGTLAELRSTGNLGILRSVELRRELDKAIEQYTEFEQIWSQATGRVIPPVNYVDTLIAIDIDREVRGDTEIAWDQLRIDFDAVCRDSRFYNSIAAVRDYTFDVAAWLGITGTAFEQLREAIALEMRNQGVVGPRAD